MKKLLNYPVYGSLLRRLRLLLTRQKINGLFKIRKQKADLDAVSAAAKNMQSDAPACNVCGHIMMRSGTCYKCLNCGNQGGCS